MTTTILSGMKAIQEYCRSVSFVSSEATILKMIRDYGFPASKILGTWVSDKDSITRWRRNCVEGKPYPEVDPDEGEPEFHAGADQKKIKISGEEPAELLTEKQFNDRISKIEMQLDKIIACLGLLEKGRMTPEEKWVLEQVNTKLGMSPSCFGQDGNTRSTPKSREDWAKSVVLQHQKKREAKKAKMKEAEKNKKP